jgi:chromosome segregation ATPase
MISVLYLAEVQKKTGFMGGGKAELKLLACQRGDVWNAVTGDETIAAPEEMNNYSGGALVMVELSGSKQVQRHNEAGRQLVTILQNFSRVQEKSKTQNEEIAQWRESLTFQSHALNEREAELEEREEALQNMEGEFQRLEQERQAVESLRQDVEASRQSFESKSAELEGAWAQLHGETRRLEERQAELQGNVGLDTAQAHYLQELLYRVSSTGSPVEAIQEQLGAAFEGISSQQSTLEGYWQTVEHLQSEAQQLQAECDRQTQELQSREQAWQSAQAELEQAKAELLQSQDKLAIKQALQTTLNTQLEHQNQMYRQVSALAGGTDKVDTSALEQMPLEDLKSTVADLEQEWQKLSRFVSIQEEELTAQQDAINEIQKQIETASEYDRLRLENELAEEQDGYQMLNQTLVGQRRNVQDRQDVLKQHKVVLAKRQGTPLDLEDGDAIDVTPILEQIDTIRNELNQQLQTVNQDLEQLTGAIASLEAQVHQQSSSQDAARQEIAQATEQLRSQLTRTGECSGQVTAYQVTLQPMRDGMNYLRERTEAVASLMTQFQEAGNYQMQAIGEMQQAIGQLVGDVRQPVAA